MPSPGLKLRKFTRKICEVMSMTRGPFSASAGQLPDTLPVFPLTGAVLLPYGRLPLNIFEPRYINLVNDALANKRLFGMVQPQADGAVGPAGLYATGCAGRIAHFEETDDGRYLIALEGVCRFEIMEEMPTVRGYRLARVRWERYLHDLESPARETALDPQAFITDIKAALAEQGMTVESSSLEAMAAGTLVDLLAMQLPLSPVDKQAVLEALTLGDRADTLRALLHMQAAAAGPRETRH